MSMLLMGLITGFSFYLFIRNDLEAYLVFSLIVTTLAGFINRLMMYFFGDMTGLVQYLNILLFIPLLFSAIGFYKQALKNKYTLAVFCFFIVVIIYGLIGLFNSVLGTVYDIATYWLFISIILFCSFGKVNINEFSRLLYKSILPLSLIISIYGLTQYFLGPNAIDSFWMTSSEFSIIGIAAPLMVKTFSLTASPGHLAAFCLVSEIFLLSMLSAKFTAVKNKMLVFITLSLLLAVLVVSGVRSVLVMYVVVALLFIFSRKGLKYGIVILPLLTIGLMIAMGYAGVGYLDNILSRLDSFQGVFSGEDVSLNSRISTLRLVSGAILSNPMGYGLGMSGRYGVSEFTNIDNGYVELLYELGLPGLLSVIAFLILFLIKGFNSNSGYLYEKACFYSALSLLGILFLGNILQLNIALYFCVFFGLFLNERIQKNQKFSDNT
ncbi:hypothetical protein RDT67_23370 [Serratia fonticola]|uniref:O-antigen ligase-related domain-containing protein n=2 Tax=Serratia fonticola TaxID=47917 RepID=A0AAJ1YF51_SERFO|nr:O-antigen ligase family protein [Serratia fonticola]MDQ9129363.1 hypothetical protein [Serratia fonticola]